MWVEEYLFSERKISRKAVYSMKRKLFYTILLCSMICAFTACGQKKTFEEKDLPIERIACSYLVDFYDPVVRISSADYAFIGNVVKKKGCEYEDGERPYTNYDIRVIKNLKSELRTDIDIPIIKWGGISVDGSCYEVYEDDFLPKEGDVCIFIAYGTEEGELSVGGPNSTLLLEVPEDFVSAIEANENSLSLASDDGETSNELSDTVPENNENIEEYIEEVLENNEEYRTYVDASENVLPAIDVEGIPMEHYKSDYEK